MISDSLSIFGVALVLSFLGAIPPGSINMTTLKYSLLHHKSIAIYFALTVTFVECLYASVVVNFQTYFLTNLFFDFYFKIISGILLIIMGIAGIIFHKKKNYEIDKENEQEREEYSILRSIKKGLFLGITNPLIIPYWLAITISLESHGVIQFYENNWIFYIIGIGTGNFLCLLAIVLISQPFVKIFKNKQLLHRIYSISLLLIGILMLLQVTFFRFA